MAHKRHKWVKIKEGDVAFAVTTPSVAYETLVARIENDVYRAGGVMKMLGDGYLRCKLIIS